MAEKRLRRVEFGDFQTPLELAREVCELVKRSGFSPKTILEPTCGQGAFLKASLATFPSAKRIIGVEYNAVYASTARSAVSATTQINVDILEGDFFCFDWEHILAQSEGKILVLGNPPWVTNAVLGSYQSSNLPIKSNVDFLRGIDAITGKSNFDISEFMLRESLGWISRCDGMLAVLCKTSVARKVLAFAWSQRIPIESAAIYRIDAKLHFGASVDACLLCVRSNGNGNARECADYESLDAIKPRIVFGLREAEVVADVKLYERWEHLRQRGLSGWRSGVKHDCSKVFELEQHDGIWKNGLGESVDVEQEVVFPLLKSSDLAARRPPRKWLLASQKSTSDSPEMLQTSAPKAWSYLRQHEELLNNRASRVYKKRPPFSIFGIGPYSFAPWKVGISGLYKTLTFVAVGPVEDKPTLLDDTCYLFPCDSQEECELLLSLVTSDIATEFFRALIFWDMKRPITAKLLNSLDFFFLAQELGIDSQLVQCLAERQVVGYSRHRNQPLLFR